MSLSSDAMDRVHSKHLQATKLLTFLAIASLLLASCNASKSSGVVTTTTPKPLPEIRIYMPQYEPLRTMLNAMVQAAPDSAKVTLKFQDRTDSEAKQVPQLAAQGQPPDLIFSFPPYVSQLVDAGLLLDLRELMNTDSQFNSEAIYEQALTGGRVAGNAGQYAIPFVADNFELYYNKTLFQKAHVPMPSADWTWSDLVSTCQNLQSSLPDVSCLALQPSDIASNWYPWLIGYGGNVLSSDGQVSALSSPQAIEGLQSYAELWGKYKVVMPDKSAQNYWYCFVSQHCAMMMETSHMAHTLSDQVRNTFEWSTQVVPQYPKGRYSVGILYGFGIAKTSRNPDAAWAFLKSLLSPEAQDVLLAGGYGLPVLKTTSDHQAPAYMQAFMEGRAFSVLLPTYPSPATCGDLNSGKVASSITDAFAEVLEKQGDFAQALPVANKTIQQCLDSAQTSDK